MKILVLNGSPKGKYSTTLFTTLFLEKKHPEHSFTVLNVGKNIKKIEEKFEEAKALLEEAEVILFSYPVYTFIVPSQLHRFVELMKESGVDFSGKFVTQITTSKHFYDVTAHRFIEENCHDMGMKVVKGLSADMDDLKTEKGQKEALDFFDYLSWCVRHDIHEPARPALPEFTPAKVHQKTDRINRGKKRVAIVTDLREDDVELSDMIRRFRAVMPCETEIVNIHEFPFKGGCISCFNCSTNGTCIYKDGFDTFLRERIQTADAIVIAFTIRDHSMGSRFKLYDDRQFCNGHRTVTMGMPFGYLVNGRYSTEENLRMIIEGRAEVGGNFLAGVAVNELDPDREIDNMAARLTYAMNKHYVQPSNFLGVGGMKIFRDLIWLMQGMMRADHKFYKAHGQYDFPQKKRGQMMAMYLVGGLMGNEKLKKKMGNKMNEGMIAGYKKVVDEAKPE